MPAGGERAWLTLKADPISRERTSLSKGMKLMGSSPATMSPYTPCSWKMRSHAIVLLGRKYTAYSMPAPALSLSSTTHT